MRRIALRLFLPAALLLGAAGCSKDSSTGPTQPQVTVTPRLSAVPPTVSVGIGGVQHVSVSGGTPPYSIASGPSLIASAALSNADSSIAVLQIMGVTTASVPTAVTVKDNSPSTPKTVSISITVF
jgi:hypothetical protein